jgi:UDP-N-acetylglucosamine 2-epimerase
MKIAPLMRAFEAHPAIDAALVHTGQHYDEKMSELFSESLTYRSRISTLVSVPLRMQCRPPVSWSDLKGCASI